MTLEIRSLRDQFSITILLQMVAMTYLDREELKARMALLLGAPKRMPFLWFGPGASFAFYMLYPLWLLIGFGQMILLPHGASSPRHASVWQPLLVVAIFIASLTLVVVAGRWLRLRSSLEAHRISRGELMKSFSRLRDWANRLSSDRIALYVLPSADFESLCTRMRWGAVIPLQLLERLGRREINSIIARQLSLQSWSFYAPAFWPTLAANTAAAFFAWALHFAGLANAALFAALFLLEICAIHFALPRLLLRAERRSIDLTGYAEAYFCALGSLVRFGGSRLPKDAIDEIGRREEIGSTQIVELMAEHPTPDEPDRYPTIGSYMETGL